MAGSTSPRRVKIFDTTLRDGEQAPGNGMTPDQKVDLALRIEALGVDSVETGFPASSPSDFLATQRISAVLSTARFATFSRTCRADVQTAVEAGGIRNHEVQMVGTGSDIHLEHKRGITRAQAVAEVVDTVRFAVSLGIEHVSVGIEDATRGADDLMRAMTEGAVDEGADCIILADTTGCATPQLYGELIAKVRSWVPDSVRVSTHTHDDFGLSLANALAGLEAGADEVQVAVGGIGERAGNTPLEQIAALLSYRGADLEMFTKIDLTAMYDVYNVLREVIGLEEPRNKPIFGKYAFGTTAGIHQQGILSNPATYEFVEPSRFGRERSMLIGRHSGRSVLRFLLGEIGVDADEAQLDDLYQRHIAGRAGADCDALDVVKLRLMDELADRCREEVA